jgi:predicted PurR-regulated permease PerM
MALWVLAVLASAMFLRTAGSLLIPIVIAVLVSYALEPLLVRLDRLGIARPLGAALVLAVLIGGAGWGIYNSRDDVAAALNAVPDAGRQLTEWVGGREAAQQAEQVTESPELVQQGVNWILSGAGHLAVVVFLVYFLLASGSHFKRRFIELAGPQLQQRRITRDVLDDISHQIQRFLLVRAFTGAVVGAATWAALLMMGVNQPVVWGVLAGVFNSIPYFGPVIVSGGLLLVGFLQFGDPASALKVSGVSLAITSLEGWLLTPLLLGKTERMHVVVIFLGLLLWTWIWGAWGTILAVPMLVVIKSIADHVEPLRPVSRLLSR